MGFIHVPKVVSNVVHAGTHAVSSATHTVSHAVSSGAHTVSHAVSSGAHTVSHAAHDVFEAGKREAGKVAHAVGTGIQTANKIASGIKNVAKFAPKALEWGAKKFDAVKKFADSKLVRNITDFAKKIGDSKVGKFLGSAAKVLNKLNLATQAIKNYNNSPLHSPLGRIFDAGIRTFVEKNPVVTGANFLTGGRVNQVIDASSAALVADFEGRQSEHDVAEKLRHGEYGGWAQWLQGLEDKGFRIGPKA